MKNKNQEPESAQSSKPLKESF